MCKKLSTLVRYLPNHSIVMQRVVGETFDAVRRNRERESRRHSCGRRIPMSADHSRGVEFLPYIVRRLSLTIFIHQAVFHETFIPARPKGTPGSVILIAPENRACNPVSTRQFGHLPPNDIHAHGIGVFGMFGENTGQSEFRDDYHFLRKHLANPVQRFRQLALGAVPASEILVHHQKIGIIGGGIFGSLQFRQVVIRVGHQTIGIELPYVVAHDAEIGNSTGSSSVALIADAPCEDARMVPRFLDHLAHLLFSQLNDSWIAELRLAELPYRDLRNQQYSVWVCIIEDEWILGIVNRTR